jgi:tRNA dimethylallyltransferase
LLYERINHRFEKMLAVGALEEVAAIMKIDNISPSFSKLLGLAELNNYLQGKLSLAQAIDLAQTTTRHYAKRQITWFKHQFKCDEEINFLE